MAKCQNSVDLPQLIVFLTPADLRHKTTLEKSKHLR